MALLHHTDEPAVGEHETAVQQPVAAEDQTATTVSPRRRRLGVSPRARVAAAGAGTAVLIARIIRIVTGVVALIIALGIAFVVLGATPTNAIVSHVHTWAKWLVGPFDGMFHLRGPRRTIALNWGIGLVVYLLIGALLARIALTPTRAFRSRKPAPAA